MKSCFKLAALASALVLAQVAQASAFTPGASRTPLTGNNTDPCNWRVTEGMTFNGKSFEGVAALSFVTPEGSMACSGTLLAGGQYVLTAAHCADNFSSMTVDFGMYAGVAKESRTVTQAWVHGSWNGTLSTGADIAIVKLDAPVTSIEGFKLSTSNDLGKDFLMMGYGTTSNGSGSTDTNWDDWGYAHYGYNTWEVTSNTMNNAIWGDPASPIGEEYIADFDSHVDPAKHNTLQLIADAVGGGWSSSGGVGMNEALIAGGDSGGGDFVWTGSEWLVSGVHSWGWQICPDSWGCDLSKTNSSSWGDLMGSTAVYSHVAWINSITGAVPEPETYALLLAGLGVVGSVARRRKAA